VLTELDQKLEERGHRFVRYADDCNIYVRSEGAARRVLASTKRYVEGRMRLRVNEAKSAVDLAVRRQFLGFSFY
jgi:RNA-directed DNA polymerase